MRRGRAVVALLAVALLAGCAATPPAPAPIATLAPLSAPTPSPEPTPVGPRLGPPRPSVAPTPSASPSPAPGQATGPAGRPTRVAIPALDIDLPVVSPPRNSTWPLCDVAEYFLPPTFQHPGAGGVTYLFAHAQKGMFLPILLSSRRNNGGAIKGKTVTVWTARNHRYTYRITQVRRFQKTLDWAFGLPPNSLVLQTSENQFRSGTKVMLVARQVGTPTLEPLGEARPPADPRVCGR